MALSTTPLRRGTINAQSTPFHQREQEKENSPGPLCTPNPPPVKQHHLRSSERDHTTPSKARRCLNDPMQPRTPTPFKNALAELEKNGGKFLVSEAYLVRYFHYIAKHHT